MAVFYLLLVVPILMQHFVVGRGYIDFEKKNKNAFLIFFLILTILIMLRHESVGNDTRNYIYYFNVYSKMDWLSLGKTSAEFGFSYYIKVISLFTKEPQAFLAITAIVTSMMIYPTYRRLCSDPSLTIVLFCTMSTFVMMFSGIRQMLAIGIGFIAYEFTRNKKFIPFIIAVLIAITFHTSSFILAFMYPLYHARIIKKWLFVTVPALVVLFIFNKPIFSFLSLIVEQYTTYDASIAETGAYMMIGLFVIFTVFAFLIPDESRIDDETIGLRNFLLLSLALQMFAPLHTLAMRMNYYYIIFIPLLMPKVIEFKSERWSQIAVVGRHAMVIFFLAYFFINANGEGGLNVFPYHFFWESV